MHALEVRVLGRIASLDQGLKTSLHQLADAAAKDSLLAEQIGLGLRAEGGFQDARTAAADACRIRKRGIHCLAGRVLVYANQIRDASALNKLGTDGVARAFGRNHNNIHIRRRNNLLEMDVEAMRKRQRVAGLQVRLDNVLVNVRLLLIGDEHHDDIALGSGFCGGEDFQTVSLGFLGVAGTRTQADNNVDAGILEVHRVRVALGTETNNRNRLAVQHRQIAVGIIIHLNHFFFPPKK